MKKSLMMFLVLAFLVSFATVSNAQAPLPDDGDMAPPAMDEPMGPPDGPGFDDGQGGGPMGQMPPGMRPGMNQGMGPGMMRPGMGRKNRSPEDMKMQARMQAIMATAEAHKNLAKLYEQQNKIDEAASELKKIIALATGEMGKAKDDPGIMRGIKGKIIPVYHEIARLYLKNERLADAEKVINEGITLFENDDPAAATKLILHLGEIHKKNNDLAKAEAAFKRVIELNQKNIK